MSAYRFWDESIFDDAAHGLIIEIPAGTTLPCNPAASSSSKYTYATAREDHEEWLAAMCWQRRIYAAHARGMVFVN